MLSFSNNQKRIQIKENLERRIDTWCNGENIWSRKTHKNQEKIWEI